MGTVQKRASFVRQVCTCNVKFPASLASPYCVTVLDM